MESQSDRHRNTPFTEDSGENRPSLFWRPWGSKRTLTILPDQSKNVNLRRLCPLDKSKGSGIIKVTKDASTSGCPRLVYEVKKMFLKPSLCRVAVSPVNADRNSQSKNMESQCDRHRNTSFTEDSGEKTARRCFGALGVQKEPYLFYQTGRKMSINGVCCAIGKRKAWHSIQQEGAAGKRSAPSGDFAVCRRDCVRLFRFCLTGSSAHRIPAAEERRKAPQAPGQSRRCGRPRYAAI